jgi:hypothetical protein
LLNDKSGDTSIVYARLESRHATLAGYSPMGASMRAAPFIFAILCGFTTVSAAAEDDKSRKRNRFICLRLNSTAIPEGSAPINRAYGTHPIRPTNFK